MLEIRSYIHTRYFRHNHVVQNHIREYLTIYYTKNTFVYTSVIQRNARKNTYAYMQKNTLRYTKILLINIIL